MTPDTPTNARELARRILDKYSSYSPDSGPSFRWQAIATLCNAVLAPRDGDERLRALQRDLTARRDALRGLQPGASHYVACSAWSNGLNEALVEIARLLADEPVAEAQQNNPRIGGHGDPQKDIASREGGADSQPQKSTDPVSGGSGVAGSTPAPGATSIDTLRTLLAAAPEAEAVPTDHLRDATKKVMAHAPVLPIERVEFVRDGVWHQLRVERVRVNAHATLDVVVGDPGDLTRRDDGSDKEKT